MILLLIWGAIDERLCGSEYSVQRCRGKATRQCRGGKGEEDSTDKSREEACERSPLKPFVAWGGLLSVTVRYKVRTYVVEGVNN